MRRWWTPSACMTTSTQQKGAPTSTSRSTYDDQRSKPPTLKSGLRGPESLAAEATAMATQAPNPSFSPASSRRGITGEPPGATGVSDPFAATGWPAGDLDADAQ